MRTNNENVCHEFNSINPDLTACSGSMSIVASNGNINGNGDEVISILSYNTSIATKNMTRDVILMSEKSYSVTTSKHQTHLSRAINNPIMVWDVNNFNIDNLEIMVTELKEAFNYLDVGDLLKVTNTEVITSQNVRIEHDEAIKLYLSIMNNKIKKGDTVLNWRCLSINKNRIQIGCHTLSIDDIKIAYNLIKQGV